MANWQIEDPRPEGRNDFSIGTWIGYRNYFSFGVAAWEGKLTKEKSHVVANTDKFTATEFDRTIQHINVSVYM